ncbi:MAG: hypothetical protein FWH25_04215 [Syntrophorhabdaceae bacterium]|nr:hypothetical protein [Syntrophorhabdaceae bacterium]
MQSQLEMYIERQHSLVAEYNGKIIALKNGEVLGEYPTKTDALEDMRCKRLAPGEFMIIKCTPGDEEYTARFRTPRVVLHGTSPA